MNDFNKINDGDCLELCLGQQKNNIISIYKIKKVAMEKNVAHLNVASSR